MKFKYILIISLLVIGLTTPVSMVVNPTNVKAATTITTCAGLANIALDTDGDYVLGSDVDCSGVADWTPINSFTGKLDGAGHAIQNLTILGLDNGNAMFTTLDGAKIYNLNITNANVYTNFEGGILAGKAINESKIVNVHIDGSLLSNAQLSFTGALVGSMNHSFIYFSSANVSIKGFEFLGGLVGAARNSSSIQYSYTEGDMTSINGGGDIGFMGPETAGGLVGENDESVITNSYSHMIVQGHDGAIGGLVGSNVNSGVISHSYANGETTVANNTDVGGLVGNQADSASTLNSYWDTESSTQATSDGGIGKTSLQMGTQGTFSGWNFENIWEMPGGGDAPVLVPYDDTPGVLTRLQQVPSRATYAKIRFIFDANLPTSPQEYIMTPCGGISEPLVGENLDGDMEVQLQQAEIGQTYSCEIFTRNLTEVESNHLAIGPFKVIPNSSTGAGYANGGAVGQSPEQPIPNQQTEVLTPEQQIATPTLGLTSLLTTNLYFGLRSKDVKTLQQYLNTHGFKIAETGPGSPGNETETFGKLTRDAVIRFQKAKGINPAVGYVGPITRGIINQQ